MSEAKTRLIIRVRAGAEPTGETQRSGQSIGAGRQPTRQSKLPRQLPRPVLLAGLGLLTVAIALLWTAIRAPSESAGAAEGMRRVALEGQQLEPVATVVDAREPQVTVANVTTEQAQAAERGVANPPSRARIELAAAESPAPRVAQADTKSAAPQAGPSQEIPPQDIPLQQTPSEPLPAEVPPAQQQSSDALGADPEHGEDVAPRLEQPASSANQLGRAQLTSGIREREPIDSIGPTIHGSASERLTRVVYFTELRGLAGETISHRWEHEGQVVAEVEFEVGGDRWRVYSSKNLPRNRAGAWRVVVVNDEGQALGGEEFTFTSQ